MLGLSIDQYVLQARVVPLALALVPLGVVAGLIGLTSSRILAFGLAIVGPSLLALVGADVVRSLGRDLQVRAWDKAGGSPTTLAFLSDDETGADRRRRLESVTGVQVHPERASIERASSALRDLASNPTQFPRIPIANASYGRARHLLALRPYAIVIALAADASLMYMLTPFPAPGPLASIPLTQTVLALAVCVVVTGFWIFFPTEQRFKRAGDDYADRLLAALDVLSGQDTTKSE